jgi:hypothetical protein
MNCQQLINSYLVWLKDRLHVEQINGACEITTPFLDRHNDRLQIYVKETVAGIRVTDDGYTLADLESSGMSLDTAPRQEALSTILNSYGVRQDDGELFVECTVADFPQKKHALVQAMLRVNDMFIASRPKFTSLFIEDVQAFLDRDDDVRYTPKVDFLGRSGFHHKFDFVIPHSRKAPERVIRAINQPTRDSATSLLFAWTDTKETRKQDSVAYAILNDAEKPLPADVLSAFEHYEVRSILWSRREEARPDLAA